MAVNSNLSSRKIPTQARGDKVSGTVSYYRNPKLLELGRLNKMLTGNILLRAQVLLDFTGSADFRVGEASTSVWLPFKNRTPSLFDNFIMTNYKLVKIFSAVLYSTRYSDMLTEIALSFRSFVPEGIRDRKKDIYSGCRIRLRRFTDESLARFSTVWRFSLYTGFSYTPSKGLLDFKNSACGSKSLLFGDLAGVYFLGSGSENLSQYRLTISCSVPTSSSFDVPPSVRKPLRTESLARLHTLASVFRL